MPWPTQCGAAMVVNPGSCVDSRRAALDRKQASSSLLASPRLRSRFGGMGAATYHRPYLLRDEHVGALDVSVDDALIVEVSHPQQNLMHEPPHQVFPKNSKLLQHARDRPPRDVLQKDVEMPRSSIGAAVANDVPAPIRFHQTQTQRKKVMEASCRGGAQTRQLPSLMLNLHQPAPTQTAL